MKAVHEELSNFFEGKGLSQQEVADKMGVSKPYINAVLNGRKSIGRKQAVKMENLFGLSASWLLTGEGTMMVSENEVPITPDGDLELIDNAKSFQLLSSITKSLLNEISAQRRVTEKAQQQIDRVISLLENKLCDNIKSEQK